MPKRENGLLLQDIFEAGAKILKYTEGYSFKDFENDERTVDAVVRNFEIIGEASKNLPASFRKDHAEIAWREVISYRNLLIHQYFGVSLKAVWDIVQTDLSELLKKVETAMKGI